MLSSSPSPPNHPKDKSSRKKDRLPKVRRGRNTQYKFVQTNPRAYNSDQLRGFAPNVSLSDTRPRRGIRRFQPTGGPHLEPSLLPIISACSEYPGPIEFVIEVFPKETTSALDELVPTPPSPPPVESIPPPAPPPAPPPTPPPTPACNSDLLDLWGKELPTLQSHCTLCNEKFPEVRDLAPIGSC